ncbi:histidine phosphatase family protein [Paenibacillus xylanexedens]|uniref:histidine phosphatase family protein n=1 Tax=Paenibacillus TaxID=44249 RepID=UPI0030EDE6A5
MATTIGLIRHGVTEWNTLSKAQGISDIPLNEEGIEQATALAKRLSSEEWDVIFSSNSWYGRFQSGRKARSNFSRETD